MPAGASRPSVLARWTPMATQHATESRIIIIKQEYLTSNLYPEIRFLVNLDLCVSWYPPFLGITISSRWM